MLLLYKILTPIFLLVLTANDVVNGKFPGHFGSRPEVSFYDCLYNYFACTDSETFGEFPMNYRYCRERYTSCLDTTKWNLDVEEKGDVTITRPKKGPYHISTNEAKDEVIKESGHFLPIYSVFYTLCNAFARTLSCGNYGPIKVLNGFFGRSNIGTCADPEIKDPWPCFVEEPWIDYFENECEEENECDVLVDDLDPGFCKDTHPYVELLTTCEDFETPDIDSNGPFNSSYIKESALDRDISTAFVTAAAATPYIIIYHTADFRFEKVFVFTERGSQFVDIASIQVENAPRQRLGEITDINALIGSRSNDICVKVSEWDLSFFCNVNDKFGRTIIFSRLRGRLSITEISFQVIP